MFCNFVAIARNRRLLCTFTSRLVSCFCACYFYSPSFLYSSLQVGRSSDSAIDCVVLDTIPADKRDTNKVPRITVSRFACRIVCDRSSPRVARVFAGGFDSSRNMFLGVSATDAGFGTELLYPCPY